MYLTTKVRLYPNTEQARALLETIEHFNAACNYASETAFSRRAFNLTELHSLVYRKIRELFSLPATFAAGVIQRVLASYKTNKDVLHRFRKRSAAIYYPQAYRFCSNEGKVSLSTISGRIKVPFALKYPRNIAPQQLERTTCQLVYQNGKFFLLVPFQVSEKPQPSSTDRFLGVDFGIVNLATDSDGNRYSGEAVRKIKKKYERLIAHLQRKAEEKKKQGKRPKSIYRLLQSISHKVHNFVTTTNHTISKRLVARAKDTQRGIAIENLTGIRRRATATAQQRRERETWSFRQLREFIEYKAQLAGVVVVVVNPHYTSITCPRCNHVGKENRPDRDTFICASCGFAGHADVIAACNIAHRAITRWPYAAPSRAVASAT